MHDPDQVVLVGLQLFLRELLRVEELPASITCAYLFLCEVVGAGLASVLLLGQLKICLMCLRVNPVEQHVAQSRIRIALDLAIALVAAHVQVVQQWLRAEVIMRN